MESLVTEPMPQPTSNEHALALIISKRTRQLAERDTEILKLNGQIEMLNRLVLRQKNRIVELEAHHPFTPTVAQTCIANLNGMDKVTRQTIYEAWGDHGLSMEDISKAYNVPVSVVRDILSEK